MGISSGASLLLRPEPPVPPEKLLGAMKTSADGLLGLLETTLAYERTATGGLQLNPAPQALGPWWNDTLAPLQLRAHEKGLKFEADALPADVTARFDATRLAQVLSNVVSNAVKFTPHGGVRVRGRWDAGTQRLHVEVEDDGPGIPAEELPQLFEPYAQGRAGRSSASGAGLGLAITQQIVLAMGGRIDAQPGRAAGSLFTIDVPLEVL